MYISDKLVWPPPTDFISCHLIPFVSLLFVLYREVSITAVSNCWKFCVWRTSEELIHLDIIPGTPNLVKPRRWYRLNFCRQTQFQTTVLRFVTVLQKDINAVAHHSTHTWWKKKVSQSGLPYFTENHLSSDFAYMLSNTMECQPLQGPEDKLICSFSPSPSSHPSRPIHPKPTVFSLTATM